jgi:hypothetical protein
MNLQVSYEDCLQSKSNAFFNEITARGTFPDVTFDSVAQAAADRIAQADDLAA